MTAPARNDRSSAPGAGRTPSSLTTTGRVVTSYLPGEANDLLGWARHREVLRRFRRSHPCRRFPPSRRTTSSTRLAGRAAGH